MRHEIFREMLVFVGLLTAMGCFTAIALTLIKQFRVRQLPSPDLTRRLDEIADRISRIETAVDTTALEVERIAEGQRFTTRLLAERSGAPPIGEKVRPVGTTTPH